MTLSEILSLRTTDPRTFDALVAEKVLGWTRPPGPSLGDTKIGDWYQPKGTTEYVLHAKTGQRASWHDWCNAFLWPGNGGMIPEFHDDPAADLEVHDLACVWSDNRRREYFGWLGAMLANRCFDRKDTKPRRDCYLSLMEFYQPGDYAAAALATVESI